MKAYYITLDTHIRKIADVTFEIFKFKNRSVGNFATYVAIMLSFPFLIRGSFER